MLQDEFVKSLRLLGQGAELVDGLRRQRQRPAPGDLKGAKARQRGYATIDRRGQARRDAAREPSAKGSR